MASENPGHRRNRSANNIPLQDLNGHGVAQEHGRSGGPGSPDGHRRGLSEHLARFTSGRDANRRYAPISSEERPVTPPARGPLLRNPITLVTSPDGGQERIPDHDDEQVSSPMEDVGAFQEAITFAGLSYNLDSGSASDHEDDHMEDTPPASSRLNRPSLPSLRTNRDSIDDWHSVELSDGPVFVSPGGADALDDDMQPLTDTSRLQPDGAFDAQVSADGQRHDRQARLGSGRTSGLSVHFSTRNSRSGSRLGDDLNNLEAGGSDLSRSPSHRKRSLSPSAAESPLARTGTMLRKMSQRVVNVSNEQVDTLVERSMKRRPSTRGPLQLTSTSPSIPEHPTSTTEFGAGDGTSTSIRSHSTEKTPSASPVIEAATPHELPPIDRNPLRGKSIGIFSPESQIRQKFLAFLVHPLWEPFVLLLIIIQTVILAIDSARNVYEHPRPTNWGNSWTDFALFGIFIIYTVELVIKVIVSGFLFNPREYSTIDRSVGIRRGLFNKANDLFSLHRKPSMRGQRARNDDLPDLPPSLLRSFTAPTFDEAPGGSRQAQKKRLARRAFLRHSFNRLDFVAVVSFWISFMLSAFEVESQQHIYVFRMMSCLRILRLLGITSGTSVILRSLKRAAPTLLNVSFLISFFWLLFAIVGVQSFKSSLRRTCVFDGARAFPPLVGNYTQDYSDGNGNLQYCGGWLNDNGTMMPWLTKDGAFGATHHKGYVCPVGSYCVEGQNPYNGTLSFDNIVQSLELVFVVMSTNTFSDTMYDLMDTDYLAAALFFAAGIVILTFWLINLLIAVITSSFQVIREESRGSAFMAKDQDDMDKEGRDESEDSDDGKPEKKVSGLKRAYEKSRWLWIVVIVYGLVVNCLRHDTMGHRLTEFISASELIVTLVLLGEIILRFLCDWRDFWYHHRNWFDLCFAIITTVIEIPAIKHSYQGQAYAWLTVFQILRVYRVVLAVTITRDLIMLVFKHVSGVLNLILFVFLLTFLAAIFAAQLFRGEIPQQNPAGATIRVTFSTMWNSFLGMYQILSSENWTDVLYNVTASDVHRSTAWIGATFCVLWFIFANFITLNMFIAVIQENFDVSEDQKRLQQVRMFLQQKELGSSANGTLSLSTIFKFGHVKRQDPLDYGSAATDMLLKDGIVREFLDDQYGPMEQEGSAKPGKLNKASTFDILGGSRGTLVERLWAKIKKSLFHREQNPFYSKLQVTKASEQLDPRILAEEVQNAADRRKVMQREYLRRHPNYNVSLYLFQPDNPIRHACQRIVGPGRGSERIQGVAPNNTIWYSFSAFIYVAIVVMVLLACVTTPLYQQEYFVNHPFTRQNWFTFTDMGFAALFTAEAIIKVIADGFFFTPNAYFRSSWGFIDGIVLLTLWINVITSLYDPGGGSRAVGAFKALRALRLLNVSDSARDTFHSVIILGGWKVVSAAFVSISLLIPFAIYGLNLFAGRMMFCNEQNGSGNPIGPMTNLTDCVGEYMMTSYNWTFPAPRQVRNSYYDFDNFANALFVLFQIASQEGWVDVMWSAQSIKGVFMQPQDYAAQGNAIFFIIFNLLGAVFVLTLFVSVFMRNYTEQTGVAFLTTEQRSWLELRKLLRQVAPSKRPNNKKKRESWQEWCYRRAVTKTGWWQRSMTAVLLLHLTLLCLEYYPEPDAWNTTRDYIFLFFTVLYILNIVIRILGLSWTRFRRSAWDLYSIFSVGGTFITTGLLLSNFNERIYVQLHKLFLVSVALLLIPRNNQLDQLFKTAAASLSQVANLLATWFVLFIVYAIAMTQAFGLTRFYYHETGNINFRTVPKALIVLFRTSVGENWNELMEDFARVSPPFCTTSENFFDGDCGSTAWARALFISWNILSMYIFVNLFISLIYESFSYVYQRSSGLSIISREEIRRFKQAWAEFDPNGSGYISKDVFPRLLGELSGVFEMRIYDGDFSVRALIEDCKLAPQRSSALPLDGASLGPYEIDLAKLNRRLAELPVEQIRSRRARMNAFYEEVLVSADPDKGISFNALLMILAHYKVIDDSKSLKLEEYLRRKARLQRVNEAVNRNTVKSFFDTLYYARNFRRIMKGKDNARLTAIPNYGVPEIFVQGDDDDDVTEAKKFDIPSVAVTPVDYEGPDPMDTLGIGRAPSTGSDPGSTSLDTARSIMRHRSGSIQSSAPSSPTGDSPYLSARHRPTPSSSSIQPDWHFAAAMENTSQPSLTPPGSPRIVVESTAARNRANSAISQHDMMGMFQDSAWGQSMRRSATQRPSDRDRRPSS